MERKDDRWESPELRHNKHQVHRWRTTRLKAGTLPRQYNASTSNCLQSSTWSNALLWRFLAPINTYTPHVFSKMFTSTFSPSFERGKKKQSSHPKRCCHCLKKKIKRRTKVAIIFCIYWALTMCPTLLKCFYSWVHLSPVTLRWGCLASPFVLDGEA